MTATNTTVQGAALNITNKKVIFKNCSPFISCITEMNNTQVDDAQDIYIVMIIYNLIKDSDACSMTSGSLSQYERDEPAPDNNNKNVY